MSATRDCYAGKHRWEQRQKPRYTGTDATSISEQHRCIDCGVIRDRFSGGGRKRAATRYYHPDRYA